MLWLIAATTRARRNSRLRGGGHHRHAAKAYDLELKGGRALRQAGLPLRGGGGRLRLSFRPKACILLHDQGQRFGLASLRTNACQSCAIKGSCTTGKERLISRWCQIASKSDPLSLARATPSEGAKTGAAEPHPWRRTSRLGGGRVASGGSRSLGIIGYFR